MVDFLSSNATQDLLGVDPAKRGPFQYESRAVFDAFQTTYDWYAWPAPFYLAALLERGVRALVYVGAADYICNWVGSLDSCTFPVLLHVRYVLIRAAHGLDRYGAHDARAGVDAAGGFPEPLPGSVAC